MGCTTNPSTDGFTAVSAVTSHDRLPWLFVDTAVLLGMFPHLQKTTDTGGDLDLASSIYFYLITLPRPSFQIRSYLVLEEAFFLQYFQTHGSLPYARPGPENERSFSASPVSSARGRSVPLEVARPHLLLSEAKHPTKSACSPVTGMELARPKGLQVQLLLLTEE